MPIEGSSFTDPLDMIISAVSQNGDFNFLKPESHVEMTRTTIKVDTGLKTTNPKVWAGGDAVTGPAMVIDAIRAGQDAAKAIDAALRTAKGQEPWTPMEEPIEVPFEVDEEAVEQAQMPMPEMDGPARKNNFAEVELGYTEEMALAEAGRCMRCDGKNRAVKAA